MKTMILTNGIAKETEKALCVKARVSFNGNEYKEREVWMPKSVCDNVQERAMEVEDWFLAKLSWKYSFHGHTMHFDAPRLATV